MENNFFKISFRKNRIQIWKKFYNIGGLLEIKDNFFFTFVLVIVAYMCESIFKIFFEVGKFLI